jgi:hypothetical protein
MAGEEGDSPGPEGGGGDALLVIEDLGVGQAAEGVHGGVHEGVADVALTSCPGMGPGGPAVDPPPATAWYAAELLDVDVDQLAWSRPLHAPDRRPCGSIQTVEAVEAVAHQHRGRVSDGPAPFNPPAEQQSTLPGSDERYGAL